jgi:pyrimidine/purine-5'-nucleotide nucleosidase
MNISLMHSGEPGTIMVPARPVLDELYKGDNGERLSQARIDGRWNMVKAGINGLLYPDIGHLEDIHRQGFDFDVSHVGDKLHLKIEAPEHALASSSLDRLSNAGTSVIAGLVYAPEKVTHTREVVRAVLDRSDVVSENPETDEISIVFQGGARISNDEYTFAKMVGGYIAEYDHAPKKFITGGGRGIMRAPHSGAYQAGIERGELDTTFCGVSCGKIIAAEPPNKIVQKLAVFEQIERRLEAFTRSGQLTVLFPGGTGTFEEMLYVLAVLMEEKNRGLHYTFLMVGDETKRDYYNVVVDTLEKALGHEVLENAGLRERICIGKPDEVARRILKETEIAQRARRLEMLQRENDPNVRMDFHGDIFIPKGLREPFRITRENVAALALHREQSAAETIVNLRRFVYTVTCACISTEKEEVKRNGPFEVHGDAEFTAGVDNLMQYFAQTGRMNGGKYEQPYTIRPAA